MRFLITFLSLGLAAVISAAEKPNLIVIMTDDMGYADVGFNGCEDIPTPHIDSIAANGVKFTSGYVAYSVCGPSRAAFMTGRYGQRFGFERNPQYRPTDEDMGLPYSETTIADALKEAGYHTGVIGKWHLGATKKHHPLNRGFDEFYGHLGGGHSYFPEELTIKNGYTAKNEAESYRTWILKNHKPVEPEKYLTDAFSDEAVSFVERNHEQPFFLFLSYNAPHSPLQATEEYLSRFPGIEDEKRRTYAAMVSAVDDGVGRVLTALRKLEIEDNTLVFFLSDNGGPTTKNGSNNSPLRGNKGDPWEGGFRVPFAAQWPAGFPKGTIYDHPVISLDVFGTIAELSGANIAPERPLDGVNLKPFVNGDKSGPPHKGIFLRKFDQDLRAVRSGDHKLVTFAKTNFSSLHDLSQDISEKNNIFPDKPELRKELAALWEKWNEPNIDPVFEGLTQTKEWQAKTERAKKAKEAENKENSENQDAVYWKAQLFKKHPEADTNKDGELSWPEFKAHKATLEGAAEEE
jgi:arylsulfatase A-like enzyme